MKVIKSYKHLLSLIFLFSVTAGSYIWFAYSPYYQSFVDWTQGNLIIFYPVVILIKIVGIVWPPIPGAVFTVGSIWIIGWFPAYLADFLGSIIGSVFAYFIARRWGYPIMGLILDEKTIDKIKNTHVKKGKEFEAVFLFRFFGGPLLEVVCYAAGVLRIRFGVFLLSSVLSHMLVGIPTFYLFKRITSGDHLIINAVLLICAILIFIFFRSRYFASSKDTKGF